MSSNALVLGGRYEIISRIGNGGMADVYKGLDRKLQRYVAIKVLKKEFSDDTKFVSKFKIEAQSAASLSHPNIVNVFDVAEESGVNYIVMELVEGITLKYYIERRGQLNPKEAISIAVQVATGLEAAHKSHIVHRDIKPQNIIITRDGKVKVTDFGIARAASTNTISSTVMGSVHYISPEQARGGYSDFKSDIYSLGITLYEMVTGRVPFDGDSTVTIAIKHLQENIIPPSKFADVPYSLERIITKCTQKSPDKRYLSISDLISDLKMSLIDPDGDFVHIVEPGEETIIYNNVNSNRDMTYAETLDDLEDEREFDGDEYTSEDNALDYNPKMKKLNRILVIVVSSIIALSALFIVGRAMNFFKFGPSIGTTDKSDYVTVPDIVGQTYEKAKSILNNKELGIKEVKREESDKYDEGIVTKQSPSKSKKVKKNSVIEVEISSGLKSEKLDIPDVIGLDEDEATKKLQKAGFKVKSRAEDSDAYPQGKVSSQSPDSSEKAGKGATITISISRGSSKVTVPNLVGLTKEEAEKKLQNLGLSIGKVEEKQGESAAKGTIISQKTKADEKVSRGTKIDIVISLGDVPLSKQTWRCNASISLTGYNGGTARVILEQNGTQTVIVENKVLSNPYVIQTNGIPGVASGTVLIYENIDGVETLIGTATVSFSRVDS